MNRFKTFKKSGFTLPEVLVASVIGSMVFLMLSYVVVRGGDMWTRAVSQSMAQQRAMSAVGKISSVARRSSNFIVHSNYASNLLMAAGVDVGDCFMAYGPQWTTWVYKTSAGVLWQRDSGSILTNALATSLPPSVNVFSNAGMRVTVTLILMDTARGRTNQQLINVKTSFCRRNGAEI